ncbi:MULTISPECIES: class I adenylate-forming enzyme family protein [unclassified Saccharopolyspora]|uniref:class I adenylate-forming enzyme family protein n=1 Tax=unclassified Saccharopolyspora TaxID=2646250 RepID=UPI001CD5B8FE|nr:MULTISPECIES: AMP-binding protein [unclassified Saccharopolyspora]MCA1281027.1 AMP-binding protein [Saccharopolyspora sp. 7B]
MLPALISRVTCGDVASDGAELRRRAHGAARALAGVRRVAVDEPDPVHRLCWLLGAELAGAAALVVDPDWSRRDEVLADAAPEVVVSGAPEPGDPVARRGDERTWFYLPTTSGSSGVPKVLVRSRRSWSESFRALDVPLGPDDAVLVPGPLSSSLFLFGAVHALHGGASLRLLRRWSATAAAAACRDATVVHVVPAMLAALLSVWEREPEPRPRLRLVVCGGAAVDAELEARLHRVLPGCELLEYYGAAELSLVAVRRGEPRLRPVVEVDVRDESGASLPPEVPGALWARSELVCDGHLRGGVLVPAAPGWRGVGDRAVRHEDGTVTVLGRAGSVIGTGGHLVAAEEVEAVLRAVGGVLDVVVAGTPHRRLGALVTAVLEVDPGSPPTRARLRDATRRLEPAKRPRRWLVLPELPRTPAGKPARAEVARLLRDGALDAEVPA